MENILINLQSAVIFIGVISVLIIVHEWGHFFTAKRLGIKVEKFAIGFGPKLFSKMHQGTEYLINLVPLGGYVKMAGDERAQCTGLKEEFYSKSPGHRALVVLNGPIVNFVFAYVCLVFVFMLGYPDLSNTIGEISEGYPAQEAGLKVGDQIIEIDSKRIENWSDIQNNIADSQNAQIKVTILRDGQPITQIIVPKVEKTKNIFGESQSVRRIGILPAKDIVSYRYDPGTSLVKAFQKLAEITTITYRAIYSMITGSMSASENVTGPIGIFYVIKAAAQMGFSHLLFILGVISASLAIFNLLPVIPLDGGHLFLLGIERIRGQAFPPKVDEYIAKIGYSLIILLALFVIYNDILKMLNGTFR